MAADQTPPFTELMDTESKKHSKLRYAFVKNSFLDGLGSIRKDATVESIYTNNFRSSSSRLWYEAFVNLKKVVAGNPKQRTPNLKFAWFGSSRSEIANIICNGFTRFDGGGQFSGSGVCLSPMEYSVDSALSAVPDENGVRHVLLCMVILGDTELVQPGSVQSRPSSDEFESGVDDISNPRRYIIWAPNINSHICPKFVISFKLANSAAAPPRIQQPKPPPINVLSMKPLGSLWFGNWKLGAK
ncbi:probable inactive poly [ADP-ribose] polymerase SRO2 [Cornus florida]|uniref:probable inactive poly [ADP-ribose] polymerase SRO2 n=1 Tax=Cornus florida TaxID=4283 RepID=UPI00289D2936|nr:probable inactive poly [ADP-ribose] polymerase SRO2 [Cornus florida]